MTKILYSLLLAVGFASTGFSQTTNPALTAAPRPSMPTSAQANSAFEQMRTQLQITPSQEKAWGEFVKSNTPILDPTMYQSMSQVKTTPELMDALDKIQSTSAKRFQEQKRATLELYNMLSSEQKTMIDNSMLRLVRKK